MFAYKMVTIDSVTSLHPMYTRVQNCATFAVSVANQYEVCRCSVTPNFAHHLLQRFLLLGETGSTSSLQFSSCVRCERRYSIASRGSRDSTVDDAVLHVYCRT